MRIDTSNLHSSPYPSRRSAVLGTKGIVATSQPLAAQAGLEILAAGGNAFDAAVAASAALAVTEPTGTGLGGDAFVLGYVSGELAGAADARDERVICLNGSGDSPRALTRQVLSDLAGADAARLPLRGAIPVTVPGCVMAWADLLRAHGALGLARALEPAAELAEAGYPVSELISASWAASASLLQQHGFGAHYFLPEGKPPQPGQIVRLPGLGAAFRAIIRDGPQALYDGPVGRDIVDSVQAAGGFLNMDDLQAHRSIWQSPLSIQFGGWRVWECPPNGQGLAALVAMGVAEALELDARASAERLHLLIEAMRIGFADANRWVGDPAYDIPLDELLSPDYLRLRASNVSGRAALPAPGPILAGSDTTYVAVVDATGNACSLISSNYMGFGSGLVSERYGIPLQNRGAGFVLVPGHANDYGPCKRPFHTIIPGLATHAESGELTCCFGVMGGHMQPQGHLQLVANLVLDEMDPQRALDAPRFQVMSDHKVALEPAFGLGSRLDLAARGHALVPPASIPSAGHFGGGQAIVKLPSGSRVAGSDPRKDGMAVAQL